MALIEKIRENIRGDVANEREKRRQYLRDIVRLNLGGLNLIVTDSAFWESHELERICTAARKRKRITVEELEKLKQAFLQDNDKIKGFLKIDGALPILIKEFTGNDTKTKILAAECLCNLSLGDAESCVTLTSSAGSYLITYLCGSDFELKLLSLWTIMNLIPSGEGSRKILLSLNLVPTLLQLIDRDHDQEIIDGAYVALELVFLHAGKIPSHLVELDDGCSSNKQSEISHNDKMEVLHACVQMKALDSFQKISLFYRILSHLEFSDILAFSPRIIQLTTESLFRIVFQNSISTNEEELVLVIVYLIRVLANVTSLYPNSVNDFLRYFTNDTSFSTLCNKLLVYDCVQLRREILWLAGNLFNSKELIVHEYLKHDDIVTNLEVPDTPELLYDSGKFCTKQQGQQPFFGK